MRGEQGLLLLGLLVAILPADGHGQVPLPPAQAFPQVPQGSPLLRVAPVPPPSVAPGLPGAGPARPGETPPVDVRVRNVVVTGATVFPPGDFEPLTAPLVGPAIALARIETARVAILNRYREAGYLLTTVTADLDAVGDLRFKVVEGRIATVKLQGDIGPAGLQVLRFLNHLTEKPAIDTATLERWLLLANDVPGVTVRAVLRPSTTDPGALTLVAQVSHRPVSGLATVDNRAFNRTGPQEALAIVDLNSVTEFGERTELSIYHTAGNTQNFGQASSEFFVGGSGLKVRVYGGYGQSNPSDFLRAIGYEGFTTVFGASASYPVIRSRAQTLNVLGFLDVIESEIRSNITGTEERQGRDSIRVGRLGADYVIEDLLLGNSRSAVNSASARLSQGLPFLGGTSSDAADATRRNERTDFTKLAAEFVRTQTLFYPWNGASIALKGLLTGQYSGDVLPPVEKFYLGGSEYTRGFYSGQGTGDSALAYTFELQLNTNTETTILDRPFAINAQWYLFYDWGEAWQNQRIDPNFRLTSEGGGVRLNLTQYTEFDLEGVIRNTRLPAGEAGSVKALKADALYWRVLARF